MSHLISAFMLLTRLPVRGAPADPAARAAWAWPLVGLVVGGTVSAVLWASTALGLPPFFAAMLALAVGVVLTGALHEDGLADVADGFWGGHGPERRLEIMRDSRLGSYGALALILAIGAKAALLAEVTHLAAWGVPIAAAVVSRTAMAWVLRAPPARHDGLGRGAGRPSAAALTGASLLAVAALFPFGPTGLIAVVVAIAVTALFTQLARAKIGGQTGDVCGAAQLLVEIAVTAALLAG